MIKIICFGKFKEAEMQSISTDYFKRISKYHKVEIIELKEETNRSVGENLTLESIKLEKYLDSHSYVIAMVVNGKNLSSEEFANHIDELLPNYKNIILIIGSSNGISDNIIQRADLLLSFSKLTFPHLLFRIMLLEQIYRAFKILNNERYHK